MKVPISISLSEELIRIIDRRRDLTKRSTFVEHLLELGLEVHNERKAEDAAGKNNQ